MTTERPTHEEASEMAKAIVLGTETDLAEKFPETYASLVTQIEEIEAAGQQVSGFAE